MQSLIKRHQTLQKIRTFFDTQGVTEVQTPVLLNYPTADVYIDSLMAKANGKNKYLHTSPELEMKKLLVNGSGDIYQICPVFRDNEWGERNFNEFTLLEYYRLGFDMHQLMDDITELLHALGVEHQAIRMTYAQAFFKYGDIDILNTDFESLKKFAKSHQLTDDFQHIEDLQTLLFVHLIEPQLINMPVCFIYDYPEAQSALARVEGQVAKRFELSMFGVEIANGYDELQDADAYQARFSDEINKRITLGKTAIDLDVDFLSNLTKSLPQCAGVAIGIERLLSQI